MTFENASCHEQYKPRPLAPPVLALGNPCSHLSCTSLDYHDPTFRGGAGLPGRSSGGGGGGGQPGEDPLGGLGSSMGGQNSLKQGYEDPAGPVPENVL